MQIHFTKSLYKFKEVKVTNSWFSEKGFTVLLEEKQDTCECPECKNLTSKIHDLKRQYIKDVPLQCGTPTTIILKKIRYECKNCGHTFYRNFEFLPKNYSITNRLIAYIWYLLKKNITMKTIAEFCCVSVNVVSRILALFSTDATSLPTVFSIDEFKGNSGGNKYNAIIVDGDKYKIMDVLPSRKLSDLRNYIKSFSQEERDKVKFFICDMYQPYINLAKVYFKNATIIIDRFHIVKQVEKALDDVRIRFQRSLPPKESLILKHSKLILSSRKSNVTDSKKLEKLFFILANCPEDLRLTYIFKERLIDIIHSNEPFITKKKLLADWIFEAQCTNIPELTICANTYHHFFKEICNSFKNPYSNGVTEGLNNKIKSLKRTFFGMPNFDNFRTRILLA